MRPVPELPCHYGDPAHTSFQYLEDIATAYWYSEVLFAAIELDLFEGIGQNHPTTAELAGQTGCDEGRLARMLQALDRMEIVTEIDGRWTNSQCASLYLTSKRASYLGDFLLYRKYMQQGWQTLGQRVVGKEKPETATGREDYASRTFNYVRATDQLMRQKAEEIAALLNARAWNPPILDIGGGAGSLGRALLRTKTEEGRAAAETCRVDLLDLPEVLAAAGKLYPSADHWQGINRIEGDFRFYQSDKKYGLVLLSNFLHAYSREEAQSLLGKAISSLLPGGLLLIHDYFPDRKGSNPAKGPLYDLAMMLNTYNGRCHPASEIMSWLTGFSMEHALVRNLSTDSAVIVSTAKEPESERILKADNRGALQEWTQVAEEEGFRRAVLISMDQVVTGSWVRQKCRHGCERYGKNLQCPPRGMDETRTRELLDSYAWGLLLEGAPPGGEFHAQLLALEKRAFLSGFPKAFAMGAGHCPVCRQCADDNVCRSPGQARPSMEGSGIDVYATAANASISLRPLQEKMQYVKYLGLLLLE